MTLKKLVNISISTLATIMKSFSHIYYRSLILFQSRKQNKNQLAVFHQLFFNVSISFQSAISFSNKISKTHGHVQMECRACPQHFTLCVTFINASSYRSSCEIPSCFIMLCLLCLNGLSSAIFANVNRICKILFFPKNFLGE